MRRFFTISFIILALAVSAAGVAPAAHAAGTGTEGVKCDPLGDDCATNFSCLVDADKGYQTCQSDGSVTAANPEIPPQTQTEKDAAAKTVTDKARTENAQWGFGFIMGSIVKLFAWLVGIAGVTLNYSVAYNVVGMGQYVKGLTAIGTVWRILRDIGNILLIFGFLAIGISIIIDSEWYGGGKKLLPILIIAAIFTNFSLFAAEAVVDVGNLFATQIYKQINGGTLPVQSTGFIGVASDLAHERISTLILNKLGLQTLFDVDGANTKLDKEVFKAGNSWIIGFMAIILFIITAFVMFTLAFILISRFIVLILLIMVSPIGVAGLAVPGLKSWADKWWHTLFQQTITAPILLLMLYIALSVIVDPKFLTGFGSTDKSGWFGWITGPTGMSNLGGLASALLSFLIAMGLLLAVVYFAKTLSAVGAGWATKTAGKLSFGATAFVGRRTVGRASNYAARKIRSSSLGRSETGRLLAGLADRGAKASYDVRGTSALKNIPGGGIDAGAAQKGGYKGTEDKAIKAREDYAKSLKGREQTDAEKQAIHDATQNKEQSERDHGTAKDEHELTKAETIKLRTEVAQLEKEKKDRGFMNKPDYVKDTRLDVAKQKLVTSETSLATASTKLAEAATKLTADKKTEAKIKAPILEATSDKTAQNAYGEALQAKTFFKNVSRKPYDYLAVAGSARHEAAKKIIKDATKKKTKAEELVEDIEKSIKKANEEKQEGEEKPEKPEESTKEAKS